MDLALDPGIVAEEIRLAKEVLDHAQKLVHYLSEPKMRSGNDPDLQMEDEATLRQACGSLVLVAAKCENLSAILTQSITEG